MNKLNFSVIWKIFIFIDVTNKLWSLVMTCLAYVDGFKFFIQVCMWLRFPPLRITPKNDTCQPGDFFQLLPENEIWGKIMVLHVSVILFTGVCVSQYAMRQQGVGVYPRMQWAGMGWRWYVSQNAMGQLGVCEAGGTYPIGMHPCY